MKSRALGKHVKVLEGGKVCCERCHATSAIRFPKAFLDWRNEANQFYLQHRDCMGGPNRVHVTMGGKTVECNFCHKEKDLSRTEDVDAWSKAICDFTIEHVGCK